MAEISLVQAIALALSRAMQEDPCVLVLGEDVGADGGVFRATDGLLARFGSERVFDTPLSEAAITGISIGLAAQGFRPVAEIQFAGFIYPAIDQLVNHASRLRTRTRGRIGCPMVLRSPCGGGVRAVEHHSESPESIFAHIPGLGVVVPSSPHRAYGLLLAAIRDPDPVVFWSRPDSIEPCARKSPMTARRFRSIAASSCAKARMRPWSVGAAWYMRRSPRRRLWWNRA
jgi:pyruvate dehydrogenase E1 component beta subunit